MSLQRSNVGLGLVQQKTVKTALIQTGVFWDKLKGCSEVSVLARRMRPSIHVIAWSSSEKSLRNLRIWASLQKRLWAPFKGGRVFCIKHQKRSLGLFLDRANRSLVEWLKVFNIWGRISFDCNRRWKTLRPQQFLWNHLLQV